MKNNRLYHLTKTGIRIPRRKVKWMNAPKGSKSKGKDRNKGIDIAIPTSESFDNLYINNLNAFLQNSDDSESYDIFAGEDFGGV